MSNSFIHHSFWTMCWIRLCWRPRKFSKFIHCFPFLKTKICLFSFLSNKMFNFLKDPNFNGTGPTILELVSVQGHLAPAACWLSCFQVSRTEPREEALMICADRFLNLLVYRLVHLASQYSIPSASVSSFSSNNTPKPSQLPLVVKWLQVSPPVPLFPNYPQRNLAGRSLRSQSFQTCPFQHFSTCTWLQHIWSYNFCHT